MYTLLAVLTNDIDGQLLLRADLEGDEDSRHAPHHESAPEERRHFGAFGGVFFQRRRRRGGGGVVEIHAVTALDESGDETA